MRTRALGALLTVAATAALTTFAAPAFAEGRVLGLGQPDAIPGRYLVTLRDGAMTAASDELGGGRVLDRAGSTVAAALTPVQARRLAASPAVRYVEQDRRVHITATTQKNPDWGLDRIDQRTIKPSKTYTPMDDGDSVHAYVIDTGVLISHSEFGGRASYGYDFIDHDTTAQDCNGHGTHVAGTIGGTHYGVAKKVKLVAVRVLDCDGEGDLMGVIAGVNWVTSHAVLPAVANMSMGGGRSPALEAAVQKSINAGITYVVAAGNDDVNASTESPSALPAAITVGAIDSQDRRASFSNFGSVVDLFAPGVNIRSAWATGNTATELLSGTSMAAPHVAGAAALILDAFPAETPAQVRNYLVAKATTGKVTDPKGSPNRLLYVPAPAGPPTIATTRVAASLQRPLTAKLTLASSRRGSWTVAGGTLPAGVRLFPSGALSGTPTTPGTRTVLVRFVDYVPNTVTRAITFTVAKTTPLIATTALPAATVGAAYTGNLTLTDGRPGTWSVTAGVLPDGLTLSAAGVVQGAPTTAGDATFTIQFTDPWTDTATRDYTLTVQPPLN